MVISGLGPHGERAEGPDYVALSAEELAAARRQQYRVAVIMHTLDSDWSRLQLEGIVGTLGESNCIVSEVVDCHFNAQAQIEALSVLSKKPLDAIISFPVANSDVAEAHRIVARQNIKLILLDNVPTGLVPGSDYVSLISSDNFGLGLIGARLLSDSTSAGGTLGILTYDKDFYATNEREIAFRQWIKMNRPDLTILTESFTVPDNAGEQALALARADNTLSGMFVVWDAPAIEAIDTLSKHNLNIKMTTVDLGKEASLRLAQGKALVGIAAQQPYRLGVTTARATILAMLGNSVPSWIALPGLEVTQCNLVSGFQEVWRMPAPEEVLNSSR